MQFTVTSLIALAAAVISVAQPTPGLPAPLTNAKRFAAGLPPLPPRSRHRSLPYEGSKVDTARRAASSPSVPVSTNCNILATNAHTGLPVGYVGPAWGSNGVYGLQSGQAGSLEIKTTYAVDSLNQLDLISIGAATAAYPYVGVIFWPRLNGVIRYFYVGGIGAGTSKGATPAPGPNSYSASSLVETAVWKYNPVTQALTAQWVNPDGTLPATYLAYAPARGLMITGDVTRLEAGVSGSTEVTLTCVPPLTPSLPV